MIKKIHTLIEPIMNLWLPKQRSFQYRLIAAFCVVSIVPIIVLQAISYHNTAEIVKNNVDELVNFSLNQTQKSVGTALSAYEDLLYQMYTDDYIVELVDKINADQNTAVSINQLRRTLQGLAYVKPYIQSITVITDSGKMVFYDKLTAATTKNAWIDTVGISQNQLYKQVSAINQTKILPTKFAVQFSGKPYYLFHLCHRVIDYTDVNKRNGIIILSVDEQMLNEVCNQNLPAQTGKKLNGFNFIVDESGSLISFVDSPKIGSTIVNLSSPIQQQQDDYEKLVKKSGLLTGEYVTVHSLYDPELGWSIINVADQSETMNSMKNQQKLTVLVLALSVLALIFVIFFITKRLTGSIGKVVKAMKTAEYGEFSVRVVKDDHMPMEIVTIADQFNRMIRKIDELIEEVKTATEKQKNAEITALEAQINPHFLYNTLDTINWMAIDREEYEISNTINALAKILRYGVDNSNGVVEIREEVDWLKQYIFLQQTRLKNSFQCRLHIDPNVLQNHIHKLLFQPFVENAILHGFDETGKENILEITIAEDHSSVKIIISDNGKGISGELVEQITTGMNVKETEKSRIGIKNAMGRVRMYYGSESEVRIKSKLGEGTEILIKIPKE